jgi:tetratricopeptide (TPR) repeat protein
MRPLTIGLFLFLSSTSIFAAEEKTPPSKPADLSLTAVGRQHHAIQTKSHEAQEYFDQGITLIYAFNHEEAVRSFQRAAELDPTSPMPLWGIALAVGPNYNMNVDAEREKLGYDTVLKAQALAAAAPQVEKDYVAALVTRYSGEPDPDYKKLSRDYATAMKALSEKYPDDLDAATLYAESLMNLNPWKLWTLDGKPGENTEEIVAVLESVLERDPNHAGANHYYIHAVEASNDPERALPSAHRLDTMVPKAGHLVHMPAHIYERTGNYEEAARNNAEAAKVDREYAAKAEKSGSIYDLMYHSHNEHFQAMAASMAGRYSEAIKAADNMTERLMPHVKMMPMLDTFVMTPIWVDVRFNKWPEVLARTEPAKELVATHAMWRYSRALAFSAEGKIPEAGKELALFQAEAAAIPAETMFGEQNKAKDVLGLASHVIEARIAAANKKYDEAVLHWQQAVAVQDTLNYTEPADWYYPVRESLGAALLSAGNPQEAEQVFRADLKRNPRNPRSLYGLMEALRMEKREADAAWVERQFNAAWKYADTKLTLAAL